jgi:acetylornithine deacetylase/succinyl-diaminopimelate desuccinylase-like protein
MASFLEEQLRQYGVETQSVDLGTHLMEGQTLKLPPVILGRIGDDKTKRTILIYGHFDVQPVRDSFSSSSNLGFPPLFGLLRRNSLTVGTIHLSN